MTPRRKAPESWAGGDPATLVADRTMPHNLEAERSVIGAVLLNNAGFFEAHQHVRSGDFYRAAHQEIYSAIEELLERPRGMADLITIRDVLTARKALERVGGPAYIASLVDGVPRSTNIEHYARIVGEKALLRRMILSGQNLMLRAFDAEEPAETILKAHDVEIIHLLQGHGVSGMVPVSSRTGQILEYLEQRRVTRGQVTGVPTGFERLDDLTSGWQRGDDIIIAARPSIGKTSFMLCSALAAVRAGKRPAIFSMEMKRDQLELRLLSVLSGVPITALSGGFVSSDEQWSAISESVAELGESRLYVDDTSARTVADIRRECRQLQAEGGLDLVVVDYVQLLQGAVSRKAANRYEELTHISRALKVLAGELNVPVLVLSQLSRASDRRDDPAPKLSDLRETGALEQDADIVMFLHRHDHRVGGPTALIVAKGRNIPTGTVSLTFDLGTTKFESFDGPLPEPEKPVKTDREKHDAKVRAIIRNRATTRD